MPQPPSPPRSPLPSPPSLRSLPPPTNRLLALPPCPSRFPQLRPPSSHARVDPIMLTAISPTQATSLLPVMCALFVPLARTCLKPDSSVATPALLDTHLESELVLVLWPRPPTRLSFQPFCPQLNPLFRPPVFPLNSPLTDQPRSPLLFPPPTRPSSPPPPPRIPCVLAVSTSVSTTSAPSAPQARTPLSTAPSAPPPASPALQE